MVFWKSKKHDSGKVSHFKDKKTIRDYSPEEFVSVRDIYDEDAQPTRNFDDDNLRQESIEPIEDLTGEQRREIEDYVDSPIVFVHSSPNSPIKHSYIFDNNQEWVVYQSEDEVNRDIRRKLKNELQNYPEIFDQEWLNKFRMFKMSPENRKIKALEEAERFTEFASKDELLSVAKSFGVKVRPELKTDELRPIIKDGVEKELYHQLQDPEQYYVEMEGRYTPTQLAKLSWIDTVIDYDAAIDDAIEMDGRPHFLSTIDGKEVRLGDMYLYRLK